MSKDLGALKADLKSNLKANKQRTGHREMLNIKKEVNSAELRIHTHTQDNRI